MVSPTHAALPVQSVMCHATPSALPDVGSHPTLPAHLRPVRKDSGILKMGTSQAEAENYS